jgi:hypothetical protein
VATLALALVSCRDTTPPPDGGAVPAPDTAAGPATDAAAVPVPDATAEPEPDTAAAPAPGRPADAVAFGGHWYKVFDEEDGTWHEKKARCEAMGGYLACIETEEEQTFIAKLADGRYLSLGATDEKQEDTWAWINGAKFEPFGWMEGQPNNYGECEHYLATYDCGEWVDVSVEGHDFWMPTGFICEWDN